MYRCFRKTVSGDHISAWKSKGLYDESIKPRSTSDNSLAPSLDYIGIKTRVIFEVQCLKHDKIAFTYEKTVNIYIAYEINLWDCGYDDYPTPENFLFGAVKLVKKC